VTVLSVDRKPHTISPPAFERGTLNYRKTNLFRITVAQILGEVSPELHQYMCYLTKPEFLNK